jgi:hypothetical protein
MGFTGTIGPDAISSSPVRMSDATTRPDWLRIGVAGHRSVAIALVCAAPAGREKQSSAAAFPGACVCPEGITRRAASGP